MIDESTESCLVKFKYILPKVPQELKKPEEIHLTGSIEALGNWDLSKSIILPKICDDPATYETEKNIYLPKNVKIEYKYAYFSNTSFEKWEPNSLLSPYTLILPLNSKRFQITDPALDSLEIGKKRSSIEDMNIVDSLKCLDSPDIRRQISTLNYEKNCKPDFPVISASPKKKKNLEHLNDMLDELNHRTPNKKLSVKNTNTKTSSLSVLTSNMDNVTIEEEKDCIIMCSFWLPFSAIETNNKWELFITNEPLFNILYKTTKNFKNIKWIGLLKNANKITDEKVKNELIKTLEEKYNMYTVNVSDAMLDNLLVLFNEIMDRKFHYIFIPSNLKRYANKFDMLFDVFKNFNNKVTNEIIKIIDLINKPNSDKNILLFLHDYHFFFVPSLIYSHYTNFNQAMFRKLSIGLFIHTEFPSIDVLNVFSFRNEILKSMMNCSVLGFHSYMSCQNFLTCAKAFLSVEYQSTEQGDFAISYFGRNVIIKVNKVTPEPKILIEEVQNEEFKKFYKEFSQKYKSKYVYVSIDNIQFLSPTLIKVNGYRKFLQELNDKYKNYPVYLLYVKLNSDNYKGNEIILTEGQKEMIEEIKKNVADIQKEFGEECIKLSIHHVTYSERLAALSISDCYMRTSKLESFSLGIYEFLLLKLILNRSKNVEYLVNEASDLSCCLANAIKINSYDSNSIKDGLLKAFKPISFIDNNEFSLEVRNIDIYSAKNVCVDNKEKDFITVNKSSCLNWFTSFVKVIKVFKNCNDNKNNDHLLYGSGVGLSFRLMNISKDFTLLDYDPDSEFIKNYANANKRIIFLNLNDEELLGSTSSDSIQKGNEKNIKLNYISLIESLTYDQKNVVYLVSNKDEEYLQETYKNLGKLYLVSEKSYSYKVSRKSEWTTLLNNKIIRSGKMVFNWMTTLAYILKPYALKCEGSKIIVKKSSVIWDYSKSEIEYGKLFANTIYNRLKNLFNNFKLTLVKGNNYIEIFHSQNNKGYFASYALKDYIKKAQYAPDFIIGIGYDFYDEELFIYLNNLKGKIGTFIKGENKNIYTVTIGKQPSHANYYVNSSNDVNNLLNEMVKVSDRTRSSVLNLKSMKGI